MIFFTLILLDFNIKPKDIINDVWIFYHNTEKMRERFQRLKDAGAERLKPWVCRAKDDIYQR